MRGSIDGLASLLPDGVLDDIHLGPGVSALTVGQFKNERILYARWAAITCVERGASCGGERPDGPVIDGGGFNDMGAASWIRKSSTLPSYYATGRPDHYWLAVGLRAAWLHRSGKVSAVDNRVQLPAPTTQGYVPVGMEISVHAIPLALHLYAAPYDTKLQCVCSLY
jgi:hypothetical protein